MPAAARRGMAAGKRGFQTNAITTIEAAMPLRMSGYGVISNTTPPPPVPPEAVVP